ncbi:hypothetical protein C8J57DRAFT_1232952 [Mycena rebaudengoi]|nr:hypothetical protein C8J57DRAFT_1232952 [Mycena rebaudengoi]
MFSKLSVVVTSVFLTLAAATPAARTTITPPTTPQDSLQCCKSVVNSSSLGLFCALDHLSCFDLDLTGLNVPIGLNCSPITVVGNNCADIAVMCAAPDKEWGGRFAFNCIPLTL